MSKNKYKVFLVDDSPDDRFFMRTVLERSASFVVVAEARDGQEAMDFLKEETSSDEANHPSPDVLFSGPENAGKKRF